ncbi:SDR family oxidoreductase [Winogradskya consettensis]|uniref:3-oxoacyl-ACP reductase n=1 Tax=Winogradskya consettensis TaxID=113560 RepID=A0A919W0T5_9ACTN|nr:SDR family oxidoreductase [Actinoplanes consettensis]GIM82274.1 3-oxoacyl-ACP reductase [Actinoplanes consettensis]
MRNVIVTGGATGIGYAVAEAFATAGDQVVITGRRKEVLEAAATRLGPAVRAVSFDAADPIAVSNALADLPGTVDVLVNNAGGNTDFLAPDDDSLAALAASYRANLDANLLSAVLVTAALQPRFPDGARIVTIGSIAAANGAGSYGAAKAAVESWSVSVATELGPRGITSNVVSPGLVTETEFFRGRLTDERTARLVATTLNKRPGAPTDIAATVTFLASPGAGHLTGQVLHVNGGAYRSH